MPQITSLSGPDGDELRDMYAEVGQAISSWSRVEANLCNLFSACLTNCDHFPDHGVLIYDDSPFAAAFYAVENFRSKLDMVDAVICTRISQITTGKEVAETCWAKLKDRLRTASRLRNQLAHQVVAFDTRRKPGQRAILKPAQRNPAGRDTGLRDQFPTRKNVRHTAKLLNLLADHIQSFALFLMLHRELRRRLAGRARSQIENLERVNRPALEQLLHDLALPQ